MTSWRQGVIGLALVGLTACGATTSNNSGGEASPSASAASSPATATSPLTLTGKGAAIASLSGHWTVASGSVAGYRVHETFLGQDQEAVARTPGVSGSLDISGTVASNLTFSADMTQCHGLDSHVSYLTFNRDSVVKRAINVAQYPNVTLTITSLTLPSNAASGSAVDATAAGSFSMNGQAHDVNVKLKGQAEGDKVEVLGTFTVALSDYSVRLPQPPFTSASNTGTVEVDAFLTKS